MSDIVMETVRAVILGLIVLLMVRFGRRRGLGWQAGFAEITVGSGLFAFGSAIDVTDNFGELNRFVVIGDMDMEAFLEKVVGYLGGAAFLLVGFWRWLSPERPGGRLFPAPPGGAAATVWRAATALPRQFVYLVIASSVLPFLLIQAGVNFGTQGGDPRALARFVDAEPHLLADALHHMLSGTFTHTLLEWSAFTAAVFTVALAFTHFSISRDAMRPIIGMALFFAGTIDAFHILAADRLIDAVADNRPLIPFTWAISRLFNALILIVGIGLLLLRGTDRGQANLSFIIVTSLAFGVMAYVIIQVSATSDSLPRTMFSEAIITRPWDAGALLLFLVAGALSYRLYRRSPTFLSSALVLSMVPDVATEAHMAFGSTELFDSHFNVAHGLKILSYAVPLTGL